MKRYLFIIMCILASLPMLAQQRTVRGTVFDAQGEPVIGATVRVVGADQRAVITDYDGNFSIQAAPNEKLRVSYVGYLDATVNASSTQLTVNLREDSNVMDEVVVVGYGTQRKATLTGAVSSISNKEMTVTKNESVINMLSGKIPGVRITQLSSQPGANDNRIDIRGMGTPLIVVDGIPRDQEYFSRMDANEIDNISVLKDASAAIYGVRAANGVILITTKRGTNEGEDKFDITLSANYGWQSFLYMPETSSAADHMMLMNEKYKYGIGNNYPNVHNSAMYSWDQILSYSNGLTGSAGTNWTDELFKNNVPQEQYNISVNGSSKKIDYFLNLGYLDQMGSYRSESMNYNRWNFRSNVDARITDRLTASVQLSGYMDERNEPFTDIWAVYKKAWTYKPTAPAYLDDAHEYPAYDQTEFLEQDNPVAVINDDLTGFRKYKKVNFNGALTLKYDFKYVKGLSAKAFYSYDYSATNNTENLRSYSLYQNMGVDADGNPIYSAVARNTSPSIKRSTYPYYGTVMQLSLNYDRQFGDHHVSALALFEEQYANVDNFWAQRSMTLAGDYLLYGDEEGQMGSMDKNGVSDWTRRAWVGRLTYDFQGKYMADFSFREDGSSHWASGHRWGFFPSVSVGWRASEEKFVKRLIPFLSNLKFRASYGKMGDDEVAHTYPPTVVGYDIQTSRIGWIYNGTTVTGVLPTEIPNPDLTWYTAKTFNFGVDWDLWNGLLSGQFEVFKRKRDGLLATSSQIIPGIVGASLPQENLNSDETFGWEFVLGHRNRVAGVNYWVNAQISATKNRWDHIAKAAAGNSYENWKDLNVDGRNKDIWTSIEEGGRFGNYDEIQHHNIMGGNYGQGTLPGDYWYEDWNGDGVINDQDYHPVATFNLPVFNYGISLGADWKGIDLSMNWQGAAGVYNSYGEVFTEVGPFNGGAALDQYKDRWHTVNVNDDPWNPHTQWESGYYPATGHSFNSFATGIHNTSYIRLKTVELGYTLPKTLLAHTGIKNVRVYVNAYNLLTFTGIKNMDPERPGNKGTINSGEENNSLFYRYPVNRTFNVGATVKF